MSAKSPSELCTVGDTADKATAGTAESHAWGGETVVLPMNQEAPSEQVREG